MPTKTADDGRDVAGRFAAGNRGGPGRPPGLDFRNLVLERMGQGSVEDSLLAVYEKLVELARGGDVRAAALLLDRLCGKLLPTLDEEGAVQITVVSGVPPRMAPPGGRPPHLLAGPKS